METQERSKRGVFLTDKEFELLQKGHMAPKPRSKLHEKLDEKFPLLLDEIELISQSIVLEPWREIKRRQYLSEFKKIGKIFLELSDEETFKETHIDLIRTSNKTGEVVEYCQVKYDPKDQKNFYYTDRIFDEDYVLRGIKARPEVKKLLLKGYKKGIIPSNKKIALTIEEIKNQMKKRS